MAGMSVSIMTSQAITGLEEIRTLEFENYGVNALDVYFENGRQLIAFSNTSGSNSGDTLMIYDFEADQLIAAVPGANWSFDIKFINENQLLFRNNGMLYRLVNFSSPVITTLASDVVTFTVSQDLTSVALLKLEGPGNRLEVSTYNHQTGTLSAPEVYEFTDVLDPDASKISFSDDKNYIGINGGYNHDYVIVINTYTYTITTVPTPANQGTYSPAFYEHSNIQRIAVGGGYENGSIEVINVNPPDLEASIPVFPSYNYSIDFNPLQDHVVAGGYDNTIKILNVKDLQFYEASMTHAGLINQVMFTQDNEFVVSGEGAGDARLVIYRILREPSAITNTSRHNFEIFPIPAHDILSIDGDLPEIISIYDFRGGLADEFIPSGNIVPIDHLIPGLYIIKAGFPEGTVIRKITKN